MLTRFVIVTLIWIIVDFYCFQAVKTVSLNFNPGTASIIKWIYWIFDILLISIILALAASGKFTHGPNKSMSLLFGLMILSLAPKVIVLPFLLVEDIVRIIQGTYSWASSLASNKKSVSFFTDRRKFVSQIGLGLASIPFFGIIYGMIKGKYEYRVHKVKLTFKDLPEAFHGFTITQLSDIHSGSFDDKDAVEKGIHIANAQKSDLIVFTGDLVNNCADEMDQWIESFSMLEAPMGKFSILGNHDYGDYIKWESEEAKSKNLERLKEVHGEIGFRLLLNENSKLERDGQSISLLGVENWGLRGFHQYGDLDKALEDVNHNDFKLLLSHDPSHWEAQTLHHEKHIHLTLSGHTHGMQFGIEIPGFKWSPIKYIYPQWAGAYEKKDKYIYVNRGFGFLGFPGRVGILPEITVIELLKG
jgi:predicted MPP superfamily phosphohydrolase